MDKVADEIPGYTYGGAARSPVTMRELDELKASVGFTADDERALRMAGEVLRDQTEAMVKRWRDELAKSPHLAMHGKSTAGEPLPDYAKRSGLRFQQWVLDTCLRPYDQAWLDYQQEIGLRHTTLKKNRTDDADSTSHVPLRYLTAFWAVINDTVRPFLAAKGHGEAEVEAMHRAWCRSTQLQAALWSRPYTDAAPGQW